MGVFLFNLSVFAYMVLAQGLPLSSPVDPGDDPGFPIVESIALLVSAGFYLGVKAFKKDKNGKH